MRLARSYGTALIEYLVGLFEIEGCSVATLQTSNEGKNLYKRLGVKEVWTLKEYAWKKL